MAFGHGKKQVFSLDNSAGTLVALTAYITTIGFPRTVDLPEVSTLANQGGKSFVVGLEDGKVSLAGKYDPTLDAHMANVIAALRTGSLASASFEYGPQGGGSGAVKYSGEAFVASYEDNGGIDSPVEWSAELQITGDVAKGTYA